MNYAPSKLEVYKKILKIRFQFASSLVDKEKQMWMGDCRLKCQRENT